MNSREAQTLTDETHGVQQWLARWEDEPFAYLTTIGRRSGRPHRIEIWFAVEGGRMYLLSGGRDRSDWVKNVGTNSKVKVELGDGAYFGVARLLEVGTNEDQRARELLVNKYATDDNTLVDWRHRSLPIAIEFPAGEEKNTTDV